MDIVSFDPSLKKDFVRLNQEWLEAYFNIEPHDVELLENCESSIIQKGGYIFFGILDKEVIGTFALIKKSENTFELGKMAVSKSYQGRGYGRLLLRFCLNFVRDKGWKEIILYSNTALKSAIHLYKEFGFIVIPLEKELPYLRSNIKMKYLL